MYRPPNKQHGCALVLLALLASGAASAAEPAVRQAADWKEYTGWEAATERAFLGDCKSKSAQHRILEPGTAPDLREISLALKGVKASCVNGLRDGAAEFTLTKTERQFRRGKLSTTTQTVATWRGNFVAGAQAGLWCRGPQPKRQSTGEGKLEARPSDIGSLSVCTWKGGRQSRDRFVHRADGRWQRVNYLDSLGYFEELMPQGVIEQHSQAIIDAYKTGGDAPALPAPLIEIPQIADLVPEGRLWYPQPGRGPTGLQGKRVALVFTTRSQQAIERYRAQRQQILDATAALRQSAPAEYRAFAEAGDPQHLVDVVVANVRPHVGTLVPASDLDALAQGQVDYALIVDCAPELRTDVLGNYESVLSATPKYTAPRLLTTRAGFLLLDSAFRVVTAWNRDEGIVPRFMPYDGLRNRFTGDREYLYQLSAALRDQWGIREPANNALMAIHYDLTRFDARSK